MNFSEALHDLKNGFLLRRDAWHTALYIVRQKGYPDGIPLNANTAAATGLNEGTVCVFHPYLMKGNNADRSFTPWVPDMTDLFAEDWRLYTWQPDAVRDVSAHTYAEPHGKTAG